MKRLICALIVVLFMFSACSDNKRLNGHLYETYGLLNKEEVRNPKVEYSLVVGNVVWGIILFETIVAPIYFFGFDLYEPVQLREN